MACVREAYTKAGELYYIIQSKYKGEKKSYSFHKPDGVSWSKRTFYNKAVACGNQMDKELREGTYRSSRDLAKRLTLRAFVEQNYLPGKEGQVTSNSILKEKQALDGHILPVLGDTIMEEIKPAQLQGMVDQWYREYSQNTARFRKGILGQIFKTAYRLEIIQSNPMDKVITPKIDKERQIAFAQKQASKLLTLDELKNILSCADQEDLLHRAFIRLSLDVGGRAGEILALRWGEVDLDSLTVSINQAVSKDNATGEVLPHAPKTLSSIRKVTIWPETAQALRDHLESMEQANGAVSPEDYIFRGPNGLYSSSSMDSWLYRFAHRHGLRRFSTHFFRHSMASHLIANGIPASEVMARTGHSSLQVLLQVYTHSTGQAGDLGAAYRNMLQ